MISEYDNNLTTNDLNTITGTKLVSPSASIISNNEQKSNQENSSINSKEKEGIFTKMFNYIKNNWNPWKIEEEEVIDAHGFKCKRPKTKIPLRKKGDSYEEEIKKTGGESLSYATQYSGFGKLFL
jgi:hypothetical protein